MKLFASSLLAIVTVLVASPLNISAQTTPRRADGHPDLGGVWTNRMDAGPGSAGRVEEKDLRDNGNTTISTCCGNSRLGGLGSGEQDGRVMGKGDRNKPVYKPEYWTQVRDNERNSSTRDPEFHCASWGVPRMGAPGQIVQQENMFIFLYTSASYGNPYRVIPMNREHDPDRVVQETSRGDSVGKWDGDTLVVDTIGFNDETWLASRLGYVHSTSLHVIERFTRSGDQIKYEVTVEDPEMLEKPWVLAPRNIALNSDPKAMLPEDYPCKEVDITHTPVR